MPALASDLRRQLEHVIIQARDVAEAAARAALKRLAVDAARPFDHFSEAQRQLRNRLRARARQAGDQRQPNGEQEIEQLTQELAYEYWHRMLFARFLAENNLLMHPDGVAVSLADCEDLAQMEGAENGWILAARYASRMLPQIFRTDDVLLEIEFPINDRLPLEKLLASLPTETFTADDSLGWVYQFWQAKKKDEVNASEVKIGARELPAVTQLFTEPYMVAFLLDNSLGAWWAARRLTEADLKNAGSEDELRTKAALPGVPLKYLRFVKQDDGTWTPAAGTFDGWPEHLGELKAPRPLLRFRPLPGGCLADAGAHAHGTGRTFGTRSSGCRAARQPPRAGAGSALRGAGCFCSGTDCLALSWCWGIPAAAGIACGLLRPIGQCGKRRVAAVGDGQAQPAPCSGMDV